MKKMIKVITALTNLARLLIAKIWNLLHHKTESVAHFYNLNILRTTKFYVST